MASSNSDQPPMALSTSTDHRTESSRKDASMLTRYIYDTSSSVQERLRQLPIAEPEVAAADSAQPEIELEDIKNEHGAKDGKVGGG